MSRFLTSQLIPCLAATSLFALPGCGPTGGEAVYSQTVETGNSFTCSTCHALSEPTDDGFTRPGHPIGDMLRRPSYKNGKLTRPLDAVNSCLDEWMSAEPWTEDTPDWQMLQDFLKVQDTGSGEAPALTFEIIPPPSALSGGDAEKGEDTFNRTCAVCHGKSAGGTNQAPSLSGAFLDPDEIAERTRLSGATRSSVYDGLTGGRMPFWAKDRLTDAELLDIVAFVSSHDLEAGGGSSSGGSPGGTTATGGGGGAGGEGNEPPGDPTFALNTRTCDSTHPSVGQVLTFETHHHDVAGRATIVDDCTVELENFIYDGQGIIVEVYGGVGGDYDGGFAVSKNLKRDQRFEREKLILKLPNGKTWDDADGLSVWCVDVSISFGDGQFK